MNLPHKFHLYLILSIQILDDIFTLHTEGIQILDLSDIQMC